mmetsp:Transcript_10135/g.24258  ORF Transcript_10135/g.24258 Transcript_10135/m.24258 type:complete len:381 (-) Transcript_10135:134-1276(-)
MLTAGRVLARRGAASALVAPLRRVAPSVRPAAAYVHTGRPVSAGAVSVDKENPQFLPDDFDEWENSGYKNLAPRGTFGWDDLPEKYRYFHMKVDPKDVEEPGLLWKIFSDWRIAFPVSSIAVMPLLLYDVISVDMRMMLAGVTVTAFTILKTQVGPLLADSMEAGMKEVRDSLYKTEADYRDAVESLAATHRTALGLADDLRARNEAERELKHLEAAAATQEVRFEQVVRMRTMLDAMVLMGEAGSADTDKAIDAAAMASISSALTSDAALQQASIDDAIAAVEDRANTNLYESTVAKTYISTLEAEIEKADSGGDEAARAAHQRDIFNKKFGFTSETVTAAQAKAAAEDPKQWATLTAMCGGKAPTEGTKIVFRSPVSY